jgi:signal transduction histidine kinase
MQVLISRLCLPFRARARARESTRDAEMAMLRAELAQAHEAAAQAHRARHACLTRTTHELRTPLNAVLGYAQLLRREADVGHRQAHGLKTIEDAGQHMLALVEEILTLSSLETGSFKLREAPLRLPAFLDNVLDMVRPQAAQKGLALRLAASAWPEAVRADAQRLRQVLLNLLANALRFTDEGEVTLRLHSAPGSTGAASLRFEVADTGIGIAAHELHKLFRPFHQLGDVSRHAGGTGLGLTISRQLVRAMGGDIEVHSTLGEGCCFAFALELPVVATEEPVFNPGGMRHASAASAGASAA